MRALRCLAYGEPEGLVVENLPPLVPGVGEVLVDVAAASVNYPDVLLVRDEYQVSIAPPFTPGSDFAGTIRTLGPDVTGWALGDRVCGTVFVGAFAEEVVASTAMLIRVPDRIVVRVRERGREEDFLADLRGAIGQLDVRGAGRRARRTSRATARSRAPAGR